MMFGGVVATCVPIQPCSGGTIVNDLWEWDGSTANGNWTKKAPPAPLPPYRYMHGMAYDSARKVVVIFGGYSQGGYANDTWELDPAGNAGAGAWAQKSPVTVPAKRYQVGMTYDSFRGRVVMQGGYKCFDPPGCSAYIPANDTW